jgi:replicative DNA helicase
MNNLEGLPVDKEAEFELLSSLFAGPDYIFRIASEIQPDHFYNEDHRAIFAKLVKQAQAGEKIEEITFTDGESDERQVIIQRIFDNAITGTAAPHWAKKVRQYAYARAIYNLGHTFCEQASTFQDFESADIFLRTQTEQILSKFNVADTDTYNPEAISSICETIQEKRNNPGIHGIKTLFPLFDRVVKGLKIINLVTAPSGFGKTALSLQMAWNIGVKQRIPCLYLNYEMGEDELLERLLACGSGVELDKIQLGKTTDEENGRVTTARIALADGNLFITGCEEKTIDNTVNLIHQYSTQHGTKLVFVDYIGEIGLTDEEHSQHTYALYGHWVQRIKNACSRTGMKSVILAQINRKGYEGGAPGMENVSDSMQLVHKAHVAGALYEGKDGRPYFKIFKNRGGAIIQPIPLDYNKKCQQIKESSF